MISRLFVLLLLLLFSMHGLGQSAAVDSLMKLSVNATDTVRVAALTELCRILRSSDPVRAIELGDRGCALAGQIGDLEAEAICRQTLANAYIVAGQYVDALRELRAANEINRKLGNGQREAACLSNMAIIHLNLGNLGKSLENHLLALQLRESLADSMGIANSLNNLGVLYTELGNPQQALNHYTASLDMKRRLGLTDRLAVNINNMAICHRELGDTLLARQLFEQSLESYRAQGDLEGEAMVLGNLGNLLMQSGEVKEAFSHHMQALAANRQLGSAEGLATDHLSLAEWFVSQKNGRPALAHADTAMRLATEIGSLKLRRDAHLSTGNAFDLLGDKAKALHHLRKYGSLNDSLRLEDASRQMAELQARIETERMERELDLLKAENELTLQRMVFEKRVSRVSLALLVLALLLIGLAVYAYRRSQRDNRLLAEKNTIIGQKNTDILNSINYARRIQRAVLSSEAVLRQVYSDSMLLFRPKDIVSGDFFWAAERDGIRFVAVADCTGHGVPGAFVSILGHTELTKALREAEDTRPDRLLKRLDERITEILRNEAGSEVSDGMDIALCAFDPNSLRLQFCGAGRPLVVVSERHDLAQETRLGSEGRYLYQFKGSRRPVGKSHRDLPFELLTLDLTIGDRVFIFSDGFTDQFGGDNDKKFGNRQLQQLLIATAGLPPAEQQSALESALERWMGVTQQTDDICVVGFHIS